MLWREWMGRVEAAIFASPAPITREALGKLVARGCNFDEVISDIREDLRARPYELVHVAGGYHLRTGRGTPSPFGCRCRSMPITFRSSRSPIELRFLWGDPRLEQAVGELQSGKLGDATRQLQAFATRSWRTQADTARSIYNRAKKVDERNAPRSICEAR
jgi:hypothetical protein